MSHPGTNDQLYDDLNDLLFYAVNNPHQETALYPFFGRLNTAITSNVAVTHPITGERIGSLASHPQASFVAGARDSDTLVGKRHPDYAILMTFKRGRALENHDPKAAYLGYWQEIKRLYRTDNPLTEEDWLSDAGIALAEKQFNSHLFQVCDQARYGYQLFKTCDTFYVFLIQGMIFTLFEFTRPGSGEKSIPSQRLRKNKDTAELDKLQLITRRPRPRVLYYMKQILGDPSHDGQRRLSDEFLLALADVRVAEPACLTLRPEGSHFLPRPGSTVKRPTEQQVSQWTENVQDAIESLESLAQRELDAGLGMHDPPISLSRIAPFLSSLLSSIQASHSPHRSRPSSHASLVTLHS
ncbi:hypothetical protein BV25DRAFT_1922801 [Artomyces pyxidatus]|uniref:Uncharacterized protein n=1 Tax=Artomyces pyxidatus TaxID=48021 RepID=A0ACB8SCU8_9AGAM|nr:hypothetical protein BV25DRAFT_1922801 [Artomyces pyxidatus]